MKNAVHVRLVPALLVLAVGSAAALAQPTIEEDLGTLAPGSLTRTAAFNGGADFRWWKFTLANPVRMADLTFLNFDTHGSATGAGAIDTEIGVYTDAGLLVASDDDDGEGTRSAMSFGSGDATFPGGSTTGTPAIHNGRDGTLPAGTYYVVVGRFNVTFGATNWGVSTSSTATVPGTYVLNLSLGSAAAAGDPAGTIDLGAMTIGDMRHRAADPLNAASIQWYRVTLPDISAAGGTYLDVDTEGSALSPTNATRIAIYTATGAIAGSNAAISLTDATDGSGSLSQMTFGGGTRPAVGGLAYNGRDGNLQAGTYYIGVAGPGTAPSATAASGQGFGFTSASANAGTINLNLMTGIVTNPPSGVFSSTGCVTTAGGSAQVNVLVTLGTNPSVPNVGVTVDASTVGGGAVTLFDDGLHGDGAAGDRNFGGTVAVPAGMATGNYTLVATITENDAPNRSSTVNGALTVARDHAPAGSVPATANVPQGSGALSSISATIDQNVPQMFKINICDPANFSASTVGGATWDTQLFLFNSAGVGVVLNDDIAAGTLQSTITNEVVAAQPAGDYYLAVSRYNVDPVATSSACATVAPNLIWLNDPFTGQRAPNGPRAADPIQGWLGAPIAAAGDVTITLTGACYVSTGPVCDSIDWNNDGLFPDNNDLADYLSVFGGGPCSNDPNCSDLDFNNDGLFPDNLDLEAFFSVFGGGPCL
ncbi:MAG TPA: choice-of-anchor X domain-containing protein [Phycisphaerales bacterium]|nr:choice-of-anchor X domain-containing protein [Phycisphaerales bacterium]